MSFLHPAAIEVQRILVRCPNHVGDVVMSTPGLAALRAAYPEAEIVAQLPQPLIALLEGSGLVDGFWPLASRSEGLAALRTEGRRLALSRFDLGIAIPESISSALLMRLGGVAHIVGFARDPVRWALLHDPVSAAPDWGRRRLVSRERFVLRLMQAVGAEVPDGPPRLQLATSSEEEARLDVVLRQHGSSLAQLRETPPSVLAPGAGYGDSKCWPAESFAALGDRLARKGDLVLLVGASGEGARIASVRQAMQSEPIVLAGSLDLGALKVLLRIARRLVANDAGTRHIAAAFGTPSVVFFGPTAVAKTADNLERVEVLETDHACRPCYLKRCPIDHRCLRSIPVEAAEAAARRAVASARSPTPGARIDASGVEG